MKFLFIIFFIFLSNNLFAKSEIYLSPFEIIKLAGDLVEEEKYDKAELLLTEIPFLNNIPLEIERWFLLGQISAKRNDFETAIKIYRKILESYPYLSRIRFELAVCYMKMKQWYRADYHLRLSMAGDNLSNDIKNIMNYYRYVIRKNKNWNLTFNFSISPDNNINSVSGGEECVLTIFGILCRELPKPESAIGYNFAFNSKYEFKIDNYWYLKTEFNSFLTIYDKPELDDLNILLNLGPKYIFKNGDIWFSFILDRKLYDWSGYNYSFGTKIEINYDFNRKLSGGLNLKYFYRFYDNLSKYLNGNFYSLNTKLNYSFSSDKYFIFRLGIDRDNIIYNIYNNWRPSLSVGFGAELKYGFHLYIEPSIFYSIYDTERTFVKNLKFLKIKEHSFNHRYLITISNSKLELFGFVPTLSFNYIQRDSNIYQREYNKYLLEFNLQQRF